MIHRARLFWLYPAARLGKSLWNRLVWLVKRVVDLTSGQILYLGRTFIVVTNHIGLKWTIILNGLARRVYSIFIRLGMNTLINFLIEIVHQILKSVFLGWHGVRVWYRVREQHQWLTARILHLLFNDWCWLVKGDSLIRQVLWVRLDIRRITRILCCLYLLVSALLKVVGHIWIPKLLRGSTDNGFAV